jgi:N-acetylneuraminic acid mutarotase
MPDLAARLREFVDGGAAPIRLEEIIGTRTERLVGQYVDVESRSADRRSARRRRVRTIAAAITLVLVGATVGAVSVFARSSSRSGSISATPSRPGTWSELPVGPLEPRIAQYAVWTGNEMLIWGGHDFNRDPTHAPLGSNYFTNGAAYTPATHRWRRIANPPLDVAYNAEEPDQLNPPAVWTGTEMLVFGTQPSSLTGPAQDAALAYNPATNRWRLLATPPADMNLASAAALWTGQRVVVFAGPNTGFSPPPSPANNNGVGSISTSSLGVSATYDPHTNHWQRIATFPLAPRSLETAIWTGSEAVIWGGVNPARLPELNDGAAYNPRTNRWRILAPAPIAGRSAQRGVWTGHELVIWGGQSLAATLNDGAAYNPRTNTWRRLAPSPLSGREPSDMIWTGKQVLVSGGIVRRIVAGSSAPDSVTTDAAAYNPTNNTWQTVPSPPFTTCTGQSALWDGQHALLWGGQQCTPFFSNAAFVPKTNRGLSYQP